MLRYPSCTKQASLLAFLVGASLGLNALLVLGVYLDLISYSPGTRAGSLLTVLCTDCQPGNFQYCRLDPWSENWEQRTHMPQLESPRAATSETHALWSLCAMTTEPMATSRELVCHNKRSHVTRWRSCVLQVRPNEDKYIFLKCINFSVNKSHAILKSSSLFMYSLHFSGCSEP